MNGQKKFLRSEFAWLSMQAAFQHAGIYSDDSIEKKKTEFRAFITIRIDEISEEYHSPITESRHEGNISLLIEETDVRFGDILRGGHLRYGIAQKVLNLYLKYLWCSEEIPTPPQCPFDSRIINLLSLPRKILWTELDSIEDYHILVEAAHEKSGKRTLAEWELENSKNVF